MQNQAPDVDGLPPGTVLDNDEDLRRFQDELRQAAQGQRTDDKNTRSNNHSPAGSTTKSHEELYRPLTRPPQAVLVVRDDGRTTGEMIRMRSDHFLIGRTEGDLKIPDDEQISKRHVALARQVVSGEMRWVITDLQSRNGLFVRVNRAPLANRAEVLLGSSRYRFEVVAAPLADTEAQLNLNLQDLQSKTKPPQVMLEPGTEVFTEVLASGNGARWILADREYWIGTHDACELKRANDPFLAPRHAKLSRSLRGTWVIENQQTLNGVWLRLPQVTVRLGGSCEFQIGEQRFQFQFGKS